MESLVFEIENRPLLGSALCHLTLIVSILALLSPQISHAQETDSPAPAEAADEIRLDDVPLDEGDLPDDLAPRHRKWLEEVDLLISEIEHEVFLALEEDYQRDHFIRRFWKVRDPYSQTTRNELKDAWQARAEAARQAFDDLSGERARMMLYFGEPSRRNHFSCSEVLKPLEIWEYDDGSDRIRGYFTLVFVGFQNRGRGRHQHWLPQQGLARLLGPGRIFGSNDSTIAQAILQDCIRGDELLSSLAQSLDFSRLERQNQLLPEPPNEEWVRSFADRSTAIEPGADRLSGTLEVQFPGRHQSRTVVQSLVSIPKAEVTPAAVGAHRSYQLLVDGEILRKEELFDRFRYRFDFPGDLPSEQIPVVVQRYLRPGNYELILKVEDVTSQRVYYERLELEVPRVERKPEPIVPAAPQEASTTAPAASAEPAVARKPPTVLGRVGARLAEANASIATGDHTIRILPLPDRLTVGKLRVRAQARGEGIYRVAFELNDRPVMRKRTPPYSVELDLGDRPRFHKLRAIALDAQGNELAADEVTVNSGPHSFSVRLIEPQSGKPYRQSVRAHAEVEMPEGEILEKLELYLNESLVATLYQPPFEQPILFRDDEPVSYVRAVAYLEGGNTAEDVQFINAPDYIDNVDVQFVELFTTVTDRGGDPVEDLQREDFKVLENGEEQEVRRFETVRDLPLRAGLVLDNSLSMTYALTDVKEAAYRFFETVLTPRDRAALVTFNDEPRLVVRFTNDKEILAGGLAELDAEGETALYDSIIYSLHYFSGLKGKRAILVLTDGEDSTSTYTYDDAVEFARRTGVAIYVIGLDLASNKADVRVKMQRLASETGGGFYSIDRAKQLGRVYDEIQEELRSQYLIAYQSSSDSDDASFREVEIEMLRKGVEAKTIRGYYP